jgi:hypothetical protein
MVGRKRCGIQARTGTVFVPRSVPVEHFLPVSALMRQPGKPRLLRKSSMLAFGDLCLNLQN